VKSRLTDQEVGKQWNGLTTYVDLNQPDYGESPMGCKESQRLAEKYRVAKVVAI